MPKELLPRRPNAGSLSGELLGLLAAHRILPDRIMIDPSGSDLQPEDGGGHRLAAGAGGNADEIAGHLGIGLDMAGVEFLPEVLAQGFGSDADHDRNIDLRYAAAGHGLDHLALRGAGVDRIWGDAGSDTLSGGLGADKLSDYRLTNPHGTVALSFFHPQMQEVLLAAANEAGVEVLRDATVVRLRSGEVPEADVAREGKLTTVTASSSALTDASLALLHL